RYALHGPDMVRAWAAGRDVDGGGELDGGGRWQAELWRRLRERIAVPDLAQRLEGACVHLREDPGLLALPPRVAIFGLTRLAAGELEVMRALSAERETHLFLLHPSPALWREVVRQIAGRPPVVRRRDDPTRSAAANRLLASWGRDAREMQLVLGVAEHIDHHHPGWWRARVTAVLILVGDEEAVRAAGFRPVARASGLGWRLWEKGSGCRR
ncbi:MAG TPA: exodeoxyribonuclease V subunit gamma, partial [Solirubrobacteraceae bacterium]|nr:exodeoxyribonuclease V subunit gamma [Solirubrobacteraceae bacterium]